MIRVIACLAILLCATPAAAQEVSHTVQTAADGSRTLVHEIDIPAGAEDVWAAVSTVDGWKTWAVPLARDVPGTDRFETSYNPAAAPGAPDTIEQRWLSRQPMRSVSFATTRTPQGFPHADAYKAVVSTFTLTPAGPDSTRVRLTGAGYAPGEAGDSLIGFFRESNRISLEQLRDRFATGPIDWPARLAQSGGD